MEKDRLLQKLKEYDQQHLFQFWDQLTSEQQKELYHDIDSINPDEVTKYFDRARDSDTETDLDEKLEPIPAEIRGSMKDSDRAALTSYENRGYEAISKGQVGVLLLAGGQGTRLGVNYPKGMFSVKLPSDKTLYQLQAERLRKVQQLAEEKTGHQGTVPWYIMTSQHTKQQTIDFLKKHNYFGLKEENVKVFEQGMLPCFTEDGKIVMSDKHKIAKAPDGNGGLYRALRKHNIVDDMQQRGVKYLHLYCVDNILVRMADPLFIGFCLSKGADCGAKVVEKAFPTESVGVVCRVDGSYRVVEYSEISKKSREKRNEDGSLTFNAGSICIHFFTTDFLTKVLDQEDHLRHHVAKKKIPYINSAGEKCTPEETNGIKLEKFVFDVFQFSQNFAVWEVLREDEFAPLKNKDSEEGSCTPTCCREALYSFHQRRVIDAGGRFINIEGKTIEPVPSPVSAEFNNNNNNNNMCGDNPAVKYQKPVKCEISPLVSYAGEGLARYVSGKSIVPPFLLFSDEEDCLKRLKNGGGDID